MAGENESNRSVPIWHSPLWITAIIGLVSAFLTVPEIIGNYLTKQQDIKLAEKKAEEIQINNEQSKQEQKFKIVNNTLAQQGSERIFILRYLAHTLDDPDAKKWAELEVERLDDLSSKQEELDIARKEFAIKEESLQARIKSGNDNTTVLRDELDKLRKELEEKGSNVSELIRKAGLAETYEPQLYTIYFLEKSAYQDSIKNMLWLWGNSRGYGCSFKNNFCFRILKGKPLDEVVIKKDDDDIDGALELFKSLHVTTMIERSSSLHPRFFGRSIRFNSPITQDIPYSCTKIETNIVCSLQEVSNAP